MHRVVDILGDLITLHVTPANAQDREQVAQMAEKLQEVASNQVEPLNAGQGYTGDATAETAAEHGIQLKDVKLPESRTGFVLLPGRWVVEHSFSWLSRFRRLARDYERLTSTLAGLHFIAFAIIMLQKFVQIMNQSHCSKRQGPNSRNTNPPRP